MPKAQFIDLDLDDYETFLDIHVEAQYDQTEHEMCDLVILARTRNGARDITDIFSESDLDNINNLLFDKLYSGFPE